MAEYREHPGRPVRLEDDTLVVLGEGELTLWFYLEDEGWEGLLARRLAPDRARVCAVPVFAYGVNLGDEVRLEERHDAVVAVAPLRDAGNHTFRVMFPAHGVREPDERWRDLLSDLAPYGCWLDVYSPQLVAVSAAPSTAGDVSSYLRDREERGGLAFEASRTRGG